MSCVGGIEDTGFFRGSGDGLEVVAVEMEGMFARVWEVVRMM